MCSSDLVNRDSEDVRLLDTLQFETETPYYAQYSHEVNRKDHTHNPRSDLSIVLAVSDKLNDWNQTSLDPV